jgi:hypothetical protein
MTAFTDALRNINPFFPIILNQIMERKIKFTN